MPRDKGSHKKHDEILILSGWEKKRSSNIYELTNSNAFGQKTNYPKDDEKELSQSLTQLNKPTSSLLVYGPGYEFVENSDGDSNSSDFSTKYQMTKSNTMSSSSNRYSTLESSDKTSIATVRRDETGLFKTTIAKKLSVLEESCTSMSDSEVENTRTEHEKAQSDDQNAPDSYPVLCNGSVPTVEDRYSMLKYYLSRENSKLNLLTRLLSKCEDLKKFRETETIVDAQALIKNIYDLQNDFVSKFQALEPFFGDLNTEVAEIFRCIIQRQDYLVSYQHILEGLMHQISDSKDRKLKKYGNETVLELRKSLQEPIDWLVQEAEDIKVLRQITPVNNPDHKTFGEIYERLITDSIESTVLRKTSNVNESRKLCMHSLVVELVNWESQERSLRYLFLFSDILVCAKICKDKSGKHNAGIADRFLGVRTSDKRRHSRFAPPIRNAFTRSLRIKDEANLRLETKWMIPLDQLSLAPNTRVASDPTKIAIHEKTIEALKANITRMRNDRKRFDEKRAQNKINRTNKALIRTEGNLVVQAPQLVLPLIDANGQTHHILLMTERERNHWRTAIENEILHIKNRNECFKTLVNSPTDRTNNPNYAGQWQSTLGPKSLVVNQRNKEPSTHTMTTAEMNDILNTYQHIVKLNKAGMAVLEEVPGRTGILRTTVHGVEGLDQLDSYHVCIEIDSFAQFEEVARTHVVANQPNPSWEETFDLQSDDAHRVCFTIYRHTDVFAEAEVKLKNEVLHGMKIRMPINTLESPPRTIIFTFSLTLQRLSEMERRIIPRKQGTIFGNDLLDITKRDYDKDSCSPLVPKIVVACTDEIARRGLREVGIYRISGSNNEIKALKDCFDKDQEEALKRLTTTDIFVVASLLKQFFRELPKSLISADESLELMKISDITDQQQHSSAIQQWLARLRRVNRDTLLHMLSHLITVSRYSDINMMEEANLALLWSPTLFSPLIEMSSSEMSSSPESNQPNLYLETALAFQKTKGLITLLQYFQNR